MIEILAVLGIPLAGALVLALMGERESARRIERAVERVYAETDTRTYDLGGSASTDEFARAVIGLL